MRVITIGRDSTCNEIMIADPKTSRTHLQLVVDDNGKVFVVDLNSTNGTFVNGQRITEPTPLQPGDVIRIGNTSLPWLKYVQASPATTHSTSETSIAGEKNSDNSQGGGKNKTTIWLIAVSVVALISLGINLVQLFNNGNKEPDPETLPADTEHYNSVPHSATKSDPKPDYKSDPKSDTKSDSKLEQQTDQKPTREPNQSKLDYVYSELLHELAKPENKQWLDAARNALKEKNYDIDATKFKKHTDKQKKEIIDIINKEKSKIVALTETTQVKDSTDNGSIIATDGNSTSTGGGSSSNNATNGNGTNGVNSNGNDNNTNSSVTPKDNNLDKEFNKLLIEMTEKQAKEFCTNRYYYMRYKIHAVMGKKYKDLLKKKYKTISPENKKQLINDLREFLEKN